MLTFEIFSLLIPLGAAVYRDSKPLKTLPAFTDSLVNLGKMDLSFYFMAKPEDFKKFDNIYRPSEFISPKTESIIEEPCPCVSKYSKNFPNNNPSQLLKKILTSNDLFSFNKEPEISTMCCESHENVRQETIFFELSPKSGQALTKDDSVQHNQLPFLPFFFDSVGANKASVPVKPKAVEIFFLPKKNFETSHKKEAIQVVGDKEMRNDFKTMNLMPPYPGQSTVKKDLAQQDKEVVTTKEVGRKLITPATNANML